MCCLIVNYLSKIFNKNFCKYLFVLFNKISNHCVLVSRALWEATTAAPVYSWGNYIPRRTIDIEMDWLNKFGFLVLTSENCDWVIEGTFFISILDHFYDFSKRNTLKLPLYHSIRIDYTNLIWGKMENYLTILTFNAFHSFKNEIGFENQNWWTSSSLENHHQNKW